MENVFWTTIPFGTGGRRGKLYPIGTNAINDRTIGEAPGAGRLCREVVGNKPLASPLPTIRGIARETSPNSGRSWRPRVSRSGSSMAFAARPRSPLPFAIRTAIAAS